MCVLFCYPLPKYAPTIAFCTASDAKTGWGLRTRLVINVIWHHMEECFTVKLGIHFEVHILSGPFIIETDHHSFHSHYIILRTAFAAKVAKVDKSVVN